MGSTSASRIVLRIAASSVAFFKGLATCASHPASAAFFSASARTEPVSAMIGVRRRPVSFSSLRIARVAEYQSCHRDIHQHEFDVQELICGRHFFSRCQ